MVIVVGVVGLTQYPNTSLILIAGDYSGSGARSSKVFKSLPGFYCNSKGVMCNYA